MNNKEKILQYLQKNLQPICDDCLSNILDIHPRNQVNQICRTLQKSNIINRSRSTCSGCKRKKISNKLLQNHQPIEELDNKINKKNMQIHNTNSKSTIVTSNSNNIENEDELRDFIMQKLFEHLPTSGNLMGDGKDMWFQIDKFTKCRAEEPLNYGLPNNGTLNHRSDILITYNDEHIIKYISIELKYKSAVTDQFKCRSYDIFHMKKHYKELYGVMFFVKVKNQGLSINQAKKICYQFDEFISCNIEEINNKGWLEQLVDVINKYFDIKHK